MSKQFGIREPHGGVVTDEHWVSMGDVMRGFHGFGFTSSSELGVLVYLEDGEWKEHEH